MWLDSSSAIVSTVLTREGRALLAKNDGSFRIAKFSFSDDEINYSLYNTTTDDDTDILNLPILEPSSNGTAAIRYKLITLPKGTLTVAFLTTSVDNLIISMSGITKPRDGVIIVSTNSGHDYNGYIVKSRNDLLAYVQNSNIKSELDTNGNTNSTIMVTASESVGTTVIDITGKDTGATISIPVTIIN